MAALTVQEFALTSAALLVTWNSASSASGDTFVNNGRVILLAQNGATGSTTVAIATPQTVTSASLAVGDMSVAVSASTTRMIGPFPTATFNSSGAVALSAANSSTLTYAVLKY